MEQCEYILQTDRLTRQFKRTCAVRELSMSVRKNTVYGLLGPNGAGKSTLLKMLTGILKPTSGKITFLGHPWTRRDLMSTGALIESPPLYGNLTAYENLKVRALLLGLPFTRCHEVLRQVELPDTGKKRASDFSLGMKQRLGIALALLNDPKLLILDEPANGLDPFGIEKLREMLRELSRSGISVIVSSHILSEIQHVADDVGILCGGKLLYQGRVGASEDLEQLFMDIVRKERAPQC